MITCVCLLTLGVPVWTIVTPSPATALPTRLHFTWTPKSQTVMLDKRFDFRCRAQGDGKIKIRWYVNGTKKENELSEGRYYKILQNGTLRFIKVKVVDRGIYRCRAENEFKDFVFSDPAKLTVHAPAEIIRRPETTKQRIWDVGSTRYLVCEAAGIPKPTIQWRRDGQLIPLEVKNPTEETSNIGTSVATLKSILTVKVTRSANYSCTASNFPISDDKPSTDTVTIQVTAVKIPDGPNNGTITQQICIPYTGSFCSKYLNSRYVSAPTIVGRTSAAAEALEDLDLLLEAHMKVLTRENLFSNLLGYDICMKPARRIMCHLTFRTCPLSKQTVSGEKAASIQGYPLPICRESCQAVTEVFCIRQLATIQMLKKADKLSGTVGLLGMPDCSTLPSKLDKGRAPDIPACLESDHHDFSPEVVSDTCFIERGRWYNGTISITKSGRHCQRWDQLSPHDHNRSALIFPELKDAANFCRNPGGEESGPWCYTTDPTLRFELCNVKPCGYQSDGGKRAEIGGRDFVKNNGNSARHGIHMLLIIIGVPCVVVIAIFTSVVVYICLRRQKYISAPEDDVDVDVEGLTVNSAYYTPTRLNPKLEAIEFPRNDLVFVEKIGQGAFGMVFKARVVCSNGNSRLGGGGMLGNKLNNSKQNLGLSENKPGKHKHNLFSSKGELQHIEFPDPLGKVACDSKLLSNDHNTREHQIPRREEGVEGEGQIVAVKMLKEDAAESIQTDFEREASLMVEFEHENIVRLLGVCTLGRPLCLLFEYMSHGDLNDYLQLCSPDRCLIRPLNNIPLRESLLHANIKPRDDSKHYLETTDHLHIARQVCSGMVYLSDRGYVHRDLATRNCLVGDNLTVKISDFGLARNVHSMDYYRGSDRDAVPIRWMPPETILYNKFSTQSDVWSFGVLLWEVFSYAFQPYYGLTHEEVITALRAGRTLDPPEAAPPAVYSLMKSCWRMKPSSRPSFSSLHKCLASMHEEACRTKVGQGTMHL